jgi:MFS family permease
MTALLLRADDILRRRDWTTGSGRAGSALGWLLAAILAFGMFYGAVMGLFGGVLGERLWQVIFSAAKVPVLLLASFLLGLPSFFVFNTLFGLRRDFGQAVRALMATQAGLAIVLASLAPLTALWYASSADYGAALRFNGMMFAVASLAGQWLLRQYYRPLIRRNRRHRWMLWTWLGIYVFIAIQMAWIFRPFVGDPGAPVQFLREESWGNAYEVVGRLIWDALR